MRTRWLPDYVKQPDPEHVAMFEKAERESAGWEDPTIEEQIGLIRKFAEPRIQEKIQKLIIHAVVE